ncbi:MAG TPA: hypothetical protein VLB69_06975 [Rudaea sp.]|nr:hypothetical protein [Rudaea sp.]
MIVQSTRTCAAAAVLLTGFCVAAAAETGDAGPWVVDLRFRSAHIDTVGYARPANANTLRVGLGYLWAIAAGWSAYAEGTRVFGLFGDDYNSGANGNSHLPSESDPPSKEISSFWLQYRGTAAQARLGRQYVNLDNQRFFTSGLWRQNPQSFDALSAAWHVTDATTLRYLYLDEVQRTVGHDYPDPGQREWSLHGHLLHADRALPLGALAAYGYFVENFTQPKYSWRTLGLRWAGDRTLGASRLAWAVEGARQDNWRNNPAQYTAGYRLVELSYGRPAISIELGDEVLGSDGRTPFSSPYGSNHAFNGWASEFKNIPLGGLDDRYVGAFGKFAARWSWTLTAHDFLAERSDRRYGGEIDASLGYSVSRDWSIELDYANYRSDGFAQSERKLWATLEYRRGTLGGG